MSSGRDAPCFFNTLGPTERAFLVAILAKKPNARVLRNGWPDFLFEYEGRICGVEVKSETDVVRPAQRAMFAALERAGIKVYVWSPMAADRLAHWRRFRGKGERAPKRAPAAVGQSKPLSRGSFGRVRAALGSLGRPWQDRS